MVFVVFTWGFNGRQVIITLRSSLTSKCIEGVQFLSHLANIGDAQSLVIHPASTTHRQMSEAEQIAAGIRPDMIRLSVGLETLDDILWDLDQALANAAH